MSTRQKILILIVVFILTAANLYAGSGDLIVDGKLGVGTPTLGNSKLRVKAGSVPSDMYNQSLTVEGDSDTFISMGIDESLGANGRAWINAAKAGQAQLDILLAPDGGNVGIGTTSPGNSKLRVKAGSVPSGMYNQSLSVEGDNGTFISMGVDETLGTNGRAWINAAKTGLAMLDILIAPDGGNVGIGTTNPTSGTLHVQGTVYASGGVSSSRELKENILDLSVQEAFETLKDLSPVKFNYKADKEKDLHVGFIAEDVPEMVAVPSRKGVSPMDIVAVLTKVVQEQQSTIKTQQEKITALEIEQQAMKNQQAMISTLFEKVNELEKQVRSQGTVALWNIKGSR